MEKYRIDYSKWDRFIASDDEDESTIPTPRVTVLDQPSRVTFGGGLNDPHSSENADGALSLPNETTAIPRVTTMMEPSTTVRTTPMSTKYGIPQSWIDRGAVIERPQKEEEEEDVQNSTIKDPLRIQNSWRSIHYCWSQDRAAVHIRVPLLDGPTSSSSSSSYQYDVAVSNLLSYRDRHCAVLTDSSAPQLVVRRWPKHRPDATTTLLAGGLSHPVFVTDDDDGVVDWSIESFREWRYIRISLNKATPIDGLTLWWRQCLTSEPDAVVLATSPQQEAFAQAWTEAHAQFRDTVAERTKHSV